MIRITFVALTLCACTIPVQAKESTQAHLDWLTGCWQSTDGSSREVWSPSEDGYYFGYSVVLNDGQLAFFEQMRIEPAENPIFNAYPRGEGPSAFPAISQTGTSVTFANADHDYPQKIKYTRNGDSLKAVISLIDDSRPGHFGFVPCAID
ncbi:MAG: DUF6265 family protein [Pseudomonadota bacterium]